MPATLAVAVIVLGLCFGSQILNGVISAPGGPSDQVLDAGPFRLTLLPGWQSATSPSGGLSVAKGSVEIDILALNSTGDAAALYDSYVAETLAPGATGFGATEPSPLEIGGVPAARGAYTGLLGTGAGQVEGEVTTVVVLDQGYVFDAWGPMGTLHGQLSDIEQMLATIDFAQ
jgi:hypothetical protein